MPVDVTKKYKKKDPVHYLPLDAVADLINGHQLTICGKDWSISIRLEDHDRKKEFDEKLDEIRRCYES